MTTHEALLIMLDVTQQRAREIILDNGDYSDSVYDKMENYLTVTVDILAADYTNDNSVLPKAEWATWCPDEVKLFLRENAS